MKQFPLNLANLRSDSLPTEFSSFTPQQELEYLAYVVSHDLQASARHVSGFSQMLAEEAVKENPDLIRIQELSETLTEVNTTLRNRLSAITRYSRLGRQTLVWQKVSWPDLLDAVVYQHGAEIEDRGVEIQSSIQVEHWLGDDELLYTLLDLLMSNALRFTRENERAHISVEVRPEKDGAVLLRITDNGVGFDPGRQNRMFKLFSVVHSQTEYAHVGIGSGLALARRAVQRMDGSVGAQANPQGATFTVRLPQRQQAPDTTLPSDLGYPLRG
jgi:signal transduction histidine kinase